MPGMDGWEVCQRLRAGSTVPIILLTAKSEEIDKLRGFRFGVDDYVTKPFSFAELVARVGAVLSRLARPATPSHVFKSGDLTIDFDQHRVTVAGQTGRTDADGISTAGNPGPSCQPHGTDRMAGRASLGTGICRRSRSGQTFRLVTAQKDRGRSRRPQTPHHRTRLRLPFRITSTEPHTCRTPNLHLHLLKCP